MTKFAWLQDVLDELDARRLRRSPRRIDSPPGPVVRMDGRDRVLFCSNNYLNLAEDPRIAEAAAQTARAWGAGSAASRLISGTTAFHEQVEREFASFFGKEAALLLPSGWAANVGLLRTLPGRGNLVLLDRMDHASIIDGARGGEARFRRYRRERPGDLEAMLRQAGGKRTFIVTESIFSMDGDTADLEGLARLSREAGAILIVDEAHALGCTGPTGAGLAEELGLLDAVDIVVAPLGKGFAAAGGIIAGPRVVIDTLVNRCREFIYTTAPPPTTCGAILRALEIIRTEPHRRQRLRQNADHLRRRLFEVGLDTGGSTTHIVPVILGDEARTLAVAGKLYDAGFYICAIRPPTVPPGTARLRISLQSNHTPAQIEALCETLSGAVRTADSQWR